MRQHVLVAGLVIEASALEHLGGVEDGAGGCYAYGGAGCVFPMNSTSIRIHLLSTRSTEIILRMLAAWRLVVDILLLCLCHLYRLARATARMKEGETGAEQSPGEDAGVQHDVWFCFVQVGCVWFG